MISYVDIWHFCMCVCVCFFYYYFTIWSMQFRSFRVFFLSLSLSGGIADINDYWLLMMMTKPFGVDYTYMTHYIWRGCGAWWQIVIIIIIIRWTKNLVRSIDRFLFSFGCWCFIYLWLMDTWWIYDDSIWCFFFTFSSKKKPFHNVCVK